LAYRLLREGQVPRVKQQPEGSVPSTQEIVVAMSPEVWQGVSLLASWPPVASISKTARVPPPRIEIEPAFSHKRESGAPV
jgi:hypothetical protein